MSSILHLRIGTSFLFLLSGLFVGLSQTIDLPNGTPWWVAGAVGVSAFAYRAFVAWMEHSASEARHDRAHALELAKLNADVVAGQAAKIGASLAAVQEGLARIAEMVAIQSGHLNSLSEHLRQR